MGVIWLIIGYEINTRPELANTIKVEVKKTRGKIAQQSHKSLTSGSVIALLLGILTASLIAIPPYISASTYYSALKSGNAVVIRNAAFLRPYELVRFLQVAATLRDNKLEAQAIEVIRKATREYPDSFEAWQLWASIPSATSGDVLNAKTQLKRLDPHNTSP